MGVSSWLIRRGCCLIFIQIWPLYPWKVQQHTIKFAFIFPLMWQTGLSNSLVCAWQQPKPGRWADSALSCGRGQSCNRRGSVCSWSHWSLEIWDSVELQSMLLGRPNTLFFWTQWAHILSGVQYHYNIDYSMVINKQEIGFPPASLCGNNGHMVGCFSWMTDFCCYSYILLHNYHICEFKGNRKKSLIHPPRL